MGTISQEATSPILLDDAEGKGVQNTVFGEMTVGQRTDNISVQFQYNLSTRDVTTSSAGTGGTSQANAVAIASTGTGVGDASIISVDSVRYRPGHENVCMFTQQWATPEANTRQKHGILNDTDGFYWTYNGTTFGIAWLDNGAETIVNQSAFNKDKLDGTGTSGFTLDQQKGNIYKISFGWLGASPAFFSVYGGHDKGWILAHVVEFSNITDLPSIGNPSLPLAMSVERTSGTGSNMQMKSSSWRSGVVAGEKEDNSSNRWFAHTRLAFAPTAGAEVAVFTLRSASTFQTVNNHIRVELGVIRFVTDGNKSVTFNGIKNTALGGTPSFTDIDVANSVISVDEAGTTVTGGGRGAATVLGKVDSSRAEVLGTGIIINPGDDFTITALADAGFTGTVSISVRWVEYF